MLTYQYANSRAHSNNIPPSNQPTKMTSANSKIPRAITTNTMQLGSAMQSKLSNNYKRKMSIFDTHVTVIEDEYMCMTK